jgi:actin-related protein
MCKIIVREDIYVNIILSRRTTMFMDIEKSIEKEINDLESSTAKIKVIASEE